MKFQRNFGNTAYCIITKSLHHDDLFTVIPSDEDINEFDLHKNYVKKIFGKKKDFLSEYEDESSYIVFELTWKESKSPKMTHKMNITITSHKRYKGDEEDE